MKIAAFSDNHGWLPDNMPEADVLVIAGDILPLDIQRDIDKSIQWLKNIFVNWINKWNYKHTIFVPGNHDFCFEYEDPFKEVVNITTLINDSIVIDGVSFFGFPYIKYLRGWAFLDNEEVYDRMQPADVLVCHDTPSIAGSFDDEYIRQHPRTRRFGNDILMNKVKDYKLVICGHWHDAVKGPVSYIDGKQYNVSLKGDDYKVHYKPALIIYTKD